LRLRHFERANDARGCAETADLWENLRRGDPASLFAAARIRAVTAKVVRWTDPSTEGTRRFGAEADLAMDWLRKAVASRFKGADALQNDKDFDALRGREDFQSLLPSLGKQPAAKAGSHD
jgi:hypothetical protein